jgi:hypothetical protein
VEPQHIEGYSAFPLPLEILLEDLARRIAGEILAGNLDNPGLRAVLEEAVATPLCHPTFYPAFLPPLFQVFHVAVSIVLLSPDVVAGVAVVGPLGIVVGIVVV